MSIADPSKVVHKSRSVSLDAGKVIRSRGRRYKQTNRRDSKLQYYTWQEGSDSRGNRSLNARLHR